MSQNIMAKPVAGRINLMGILALAGMAGPILLVITGFIAAFSYPTYSWVRDSISSLAWTPLGWIQTIGFLAIGLLVEIFVAGIFLNISGRRGFGFGVGLLALFGLGLLLLGAFHTNLVGSPTTVEGNIHGWTAKSIFWFFPASSLLIAPSLKNDPYWKSLFGYSVAAAIFALAFMTLSIWLPDGTPYFGLFERILVADEILWIEIMGIWLFRLSLRTSELPI